LVSGADTAAEQPFVQWFMSECGKPFSLVLRHSTERGASDSTCITGLWGNCLVKTECKNARWRPIRPGNQSDQVVIRLRFSAWLFHRGFSFPEMGRKPRIEAGPTRRCSCVSLVNRANSYNQASGPLKAIIAVIKPSQSLLT
jgi:hypothetical protein